MADHLSYLVLGVGAGASIAMLALGLVLTNRSSGVVNFGHAALGMYCAYVFYEFRETGDLVLPILGLPARLHLLARPTVVTAFLVVLPYAALVGLAVYIGIFRWLRHSPPLSRVVASIGLFLYLWAMVALRFPTAPLTRPFLPGGSLRLLGRLVFVDRLVIAAIAVVLTAVLWAVYRFTTFGLASTAAAENEKGAVLIGLDADRLAAANWMISTVLAALAVILVARINSLDPLALSLLVVPALAAALLGGFRSFAAVAACGFAIGMLQNELVNLQAGAPSLAGLGLQQGLPFVLILVALAFRGKTLPTRGEIIDARLPDSPEPRAVLVWAAGALAVGVVVMLTAGDDVRTAVVNSAIAVVGSLSVVVLTGYIGQISLAPFAFAGVAAFSLVKLGTAGVPFPLAPLLAALVATAVGVAVGIPALRVRGINLAITTLGAAVAIEELLFKWGWFTGADGAQAPAPSVGPFDFSVATKGSAFPRPAFGILVLVVAAASAVAVAHLRQGTTGLHWLAVRTNERAAAAAGIDVSRAKLVAFGLSAFLAGVAGCLLAYRNRTLSVSSFGVFLSLALLAITYLAGIASVSGAVLAGALAPLGVFTLLQHGGLPTEVSKYAFALNGALLMVVAVLAPSGITGAVLGALRRRLARRAGPVDSTQGPDAVSVAATR